MTKRLEFIKMNGAGNDFVIFDARVENIVLSSDEIRRIASRSNEITKGCDQLLVLEKSEKADIFMRIYNADGSEVSACGNATRCVVQILAEEVGRLPVTMETRAVVLRGVSKEKSAEGKEFILVDMGKPKFAWQDIPLAMPEAEAAQKIKEKYNLENPYFTHMGNPHVVFFWDSLENFPAEELGKKIENNLEIFPERTNVSFAKLSVNGEVAQIEAIVWERGAGITKACGTAACAMLASANRKNPNIKSAIIRFAKSGESVETRFSEAGSILLGGAIEKEFCGEVSVS